MRRPGRIARVALVAMAAVVAVGCPNDAARRSARRSPDLPDASKSLSRPQATPAPRRSPAVTRDEADSPNSSGTGTAATVPPHDSDASTPAIDLFDSAVVRRFDVRFTSPADRAAVFDRDWDRRDVRCDLEVAGHVVREVGIRIKGASSAMVRGPKKPFNLSIDAFHPDRRLCGFKTLNLNNGAFDPTLTREMISYEIFRHYIPTPRTAYVRLYLDGRYWGVYILVEQINKHMLKSWFDDASGTRFKGDRPGFARLETSTLEWRGRDPSGYRRNYVLKTEQHEEAWPRLIRLIDVLEHTADAAFEEAVERVIDVDRALWYIALNNLVVNSDDYAGGGHNYYMYFEPPESGGRMHMLPWDLNEAFGVHGPTRGTARYSPLRGSTSSRRPLVRRLLAVPRWREIYLAHYRTLVDRWLDWDNVLGPLSDRLQARIRPYVEADDNYLFPLERFEADAPGRFRFLNHSVPPLRDLVRERAAFLRSRRELTKPAPRVAIETVPAAVDPHAVVRVRAKVRAELGVATVELRVAAAASRFRSLPMLDDGEHGDGAAGDGVYAASFAAGDLGAVTRVYVLATDRAGTVHVEPRGAEHETLVVATRAPADAKPTNQP